MERTIWRNGKKKTGRSWEEKGKEKEREDDLWGTEEEGNEEDFAEEPGNDRQMEEADAERTFLGKNKEVGAD